MKLIKKLDTILNHVITVMAAIAGIIIGFMVFSIAISVLTRNVFGHSISWVSEINAYGILYVAFLVAPWVLKKEGHVSMDLILGLLSEQAKAMANMITSLVSALVCLFIGWYGFRVTLDLYITKYFTSTVLHPPQFLLVAPIFIGSFLLVYQFIKRSLGYFDEWKVNTREKGTSEITTENC